MGLRVASATASTAVEAARLRISRATSVGDVPTVARLRIARATGSGAVSVRLQPIPDQTSEPQEVVQVRAVPAPGTPDADEYLVRQVSGPAVTLVQTDDLVKWVAPSLMPGAVGDVVLGFRAVAAGVTSPEVLSKTTVLPQTFWSYVPGKVPPWVGAKPTPVLVAPPVAPGEPTLELHTVGNGGGTTSGNSVHPLDGDLMMVTTDTVGPELSTDGGANWVRLLSGLTPGQTQRASGVTGDPYVAKRFWMTAGSGGKGRLMVLDWNASNAQWRPVSAGADAALSFNGSKPIEPQRSVQTDGQPRHSSSPLVAEADVDNVHVFAATANDGVWRITASKASATRSAQVQVGGTAGLYVQQALLLRNEGATTTAYPDRLILSNYDQRSSTTRLMLCTNARAATPTAANIPGSPVNVEALTYGLGTASGALPVVIACNTGGVYWSTNAHSAAAPDFTAFTGGPGAGTTWASATITTQGSNYVALIGPAPGGDKGVWRGVWAQNASPSTATWTLRGASAFSAYMMGDTATPAFALDGYTRPGNPANIVTSFSVSKTDPGRVILSGRVCSYRSDNYGVDWYPMPIPAGFGSYGGAMDPHPDRKGRAVMTSSDYAFWTTTNVGRTQPRLTLDRASGNVESGTQTFDPRTGEVYGCLSAGGGNPELDPQFSAIRIYKAPWSVANNVASTLSSWTDVGNWPALAGGSDRPKTLGLRVVYGSTATTATVVAARDVGDGLMWWHADLAPNWRRITASSGSVAPFSVSGGFDQSDWAVYGSNVYVLDKGTRFVWRLPIAANGSIGSAVPVCRVPTLPKLPNRVDVYGWIAADPNPPAGTARLVVSCDAGVWSIPNAHTATSSDMSVGTKFGWTNTGGPLAGLTPGFVRFHEGYLWVSTVDADSVSPVKILRIYDPFGTPRIVDVSTAATQGSLGYVMTCDAGYRDDGMPCFFLATYGAGRNGGYWRTDLVTT